MFWSCLVTLPTVILRIFSFLLRAGFSLQLCVVLLVVSSVTSVQLSPVSLTHLSEKILDGERNLIYNGVEHVAANGLQQDPTEQQGRRKMI